MDQIVDRINAGLCDLGLNQSWADALDQVVVLILIVGAAALADTICRHVILRTIGQLVKKTKATWDDIVFDRKVTIYLSHIAAPIVVYVLIPMAYSEGYMLDYIQRFCLVLIVIATLRFVSVFLAAVYTVYSEKEELRNRPLKGMLQTVQVVLFLVGGIIIISIIIQKSPTVLLTGLGASAAILLLVFKDSIMGFVSGIQLTANNMLKVGDWIQMPKYGADGTVVEVTLNTVKVRNWDHTITTLPPIDNSVLVNGRRQTNLGVFRAYLTNYLRSLPAVNSELTCMVRHLQPTEKGIPVELYFFSAIKDWVPYEAVQADVFDHVLAIIPEFDLHVFQNPTGEDFKNLK